MSNLLTQVEVADRLRISDRHVRRLIQRGDLPAVRIGRRVLIDPADLDAFVAERRTFRLEVAS